MRPLWVVIPTHNRAELLKQALNSVLVQTRAPDGVVVVDDGSEDCTLRWLATFNGQLTVAHLPTCRGVNVARAVGSAMVPPDAIVVELDDDDVLVPEALALVESAFEKLGVRYAYGNYVRFTTGGHEQLVENPPYYPWMFRTHGGWTGGLKAYTKGASDAIHGWRAVEFPGGDYGFALRVEDKFCAQGIVHIPEVLVRVRVSPGGISACYETQQNDMVDALCYAAKRGKLL